MDEYYMTLALKLAKKAYDRGEVPVGAVIVKNNKILSTAYNKKNSSRKAIMHAEIIAINKANRKIHDWRLNDCTMYVSLKPCDMCMGAIAESRISKVVYASDRKYVTKDVEYKKIEDETVILNSTNLLKNFFENRR